MGNTTMVSAPAPQGEQPVVKTNQYESEAAETVEAARAALAPEDYAEEGEQEAEYQEAATQAEEVDPAAPQDGDPAFVAARLRKIAEQRRAAEAEATALREKVQQMEVALARLEGRQPVEEAVEEDAPEYYTLGANPGDFDNDSWSTLDQRVSALSVKNAEIVAEQVAKRMRAEMEAKLSQYGEALQSQQLREGRRDLDGILAQAAAKNARLNDPDVKWALESSLRGEFAGKPFDPKAIREHVERFSKAHNAPQRKPANPAAAPIVGARQGVPVKPSGLPRSWEEATRHIRPMFDQIANS